MEALWLKSQKLPHHQISKLAGISPNTLRSYLKDYQEGGIEKLKEINFYRPQSELVLHRSTLKAYFQKQPPATINEAISTIELLTGIKRSPTQVRKFLKSMGMGCLKVGQIPSKAAPEQQAEYQKKKLEPRLEEASSLKRAVFFVDAAHAGYGRIFRNDLVFSKSLY